MEGEGGQLKEGTNPYLNYPTSHNFPLNYNLIPAYCSGQFAFPELQTMFFYKQCVIWSFTSSFKEFHHSFYIFKISGTNNNEEKSYNMWYLPLSFSNHNETSPLFIRDQWYSDAGKFSTDFDEKCKGSESRHVAQRKTHFEANCICIKFAAAVNNFRSIFHAPQIAYKCIENGKLSKRHHSAS